MFINEDKKNLFKINVTALAKTIGKGRSWTSQVLHGHRKSPETLKLIAEALRMTVDELKKYISDQCKRKKAA